jgi:hypothetical protein
LSDASDFKEDFITISVPGDPLAHQSASMIKTEPSGVLVRYKIKVHILIRVNANILRPRAK